MDTMYPKFKSTLALLAMLSIALSNGFHVVALQGVAWVKMYSEYSEILSSSDALELTFSGQEICGICIAAEEVRGNMDKMLNDFAEGNNRRVIVDLEVFDVPDVALGLDGHCLVNSTRFPSGRVCVPASPPPRIVLA